MQLARLLRARGAVVTFVHTRFNYRRLLRAKGEAALRPAAAPGFRVEVIDDGLPLSVPQHDVAALVAAVRRNCLDPFRALLARLAGEVEEDGAPPVTCVVADVVMTFAPRPPGRPASRRRSSSRRPRAASWATSSSTSSSSVASSLSICTMPHKRALGQPLEWVPGMKHLRLKDIPSFCRTTDADDTMVAVTLEQMKSAAGSKAIILNTFYEIEKDVVDALAAFFPPLYTVGPLASVAPAAGDDAGLGAVDISIWQADERCLPWLDGKAAGSVVYVNFGSVSVTTAAQTRELALGLARCGSPFLWVKRPDAVDGEEAALPAAFMDAVARGAGMVAPWCPQAAVLRHAAVALFVTHCGWNSLLEAVAAGVPALGWPVFADQTTNCRQVCECWGNGAELPGEVEGDAVARLVKEMMAGELGKEKREKAAEWKAAAEAATMEGGSSWRSVERLLDDVLLVGSK
ncbi:hypothetical protein ACP4OV_017562 [Aristida adscensionis]